ncbi:MAG: ABC transporter permease [Dermatophilaceae bacterium]
MSVFLLYGRRLLKRPAALLIAVVMPIVLVQGVVLQYRSATQLQVSVSVPDPTLRGFVTNELDRAGLDYAAVAPSDRSATGGVLLAVDGTAAQVAGHPDKLRAAVTYGRVNANNVLIATRMNGIASTLAYLSANAASEEDLAREIAAYDSAKAPLETKTSVVGNANSTVLVSSFNMIVFVMLLLTMSNLVMFIKDKTHMTTQRILLAARSKLDYYVQLVALFATLAVFEFGVMLAAMTWIFHVPLGLSPLRIGLLVSAFALFNVFAIGLGLLLVSRTTQESVGRLMITAVTLPMAMLGGALWPLSIMPGWMQRVAQILPTTWVTSLNASLFSGFNLGVWDLARPIGLLIGLACVMFLVLSRINAEKV